MGGWRGCEQKSGALGEAQGSFRIRLDFLEVCSIIQVQVLAGGASVGIFYRRGRSVLFQRALGPRPPGEASS